MFKLGGKTDVKSIDDLINLVLGSISCYRINDQLASLETYRECLIVVGNLKWLLKISLVSKTPKNSNKA